MFGKLFNFIANGGIFMVPLGLLSIVSLMFILERGFALRRKLIIPDNLYYAIFHLKIGEAYTDIASLVAPGRTTLARLVRVCLEHLPWAKAENVEAVQTQARREITKMERFIIVLEITIGISPLLGLLGTVSGLIGIFSNIGAGGEAEHLVIAKGIAEALNTTVAGLVIAIPSLIAHSYYTKKIENMAVEMETICMDLLNKLYLESPKEL